MKTKAMNQSIGSSAAVNIRAGGITGALLCALALFCFGGFVQADEAKSSTPKEAAESFLRAAMEGDADQVVALTVEGPENEKIARVFSRFISGITKFHEALVEKYGEEEIPESMVMAITAEDLEALKNAEVKIEDGKATVHPANAVDEPIRLVETDDGWRVDVSELFGEIEDAEMQMALAMFEGLADVSEKFTKRVKEEALTIEQVEAEFGEAMMALMMGQMMQE